MKNELKGTSKTTFLLVKEVPELAGIQAIERCDFQW
jgi:hypothetical protein